MTPTRAYLPMDLRLELLGRARRAAPREACGLLVGRRLPGAVAIETLAALENTARDDSAFELEPLDVLAAEREACARGQVVLGAWHSHVDAPAVPSVRDLTRAGYALALIVSLREGDVRVWHGREELALA
ncbi:MAG: hypothetical protein FJ298_02365 [Planctomycetes bacterium]|nr:hypothetical protein [Planctomycetota bacterium]